MSKKDFSAALNAGVKRDQTMRETATPSRFDRVDEALSGRSSLLDQPKDNAAAQQARLRKHIWRAWNKQGRCRRGT